MSAFADSRFQPHDVHATIKIENSSQFKFLGANVTMK